MTVFDDAAVERAVEEFLDHEYDTYGGMRAALHAAVSPELRALVEAAVEYGEGDHPLRDHVGELLDAALAFARSLKEKPE